MDNIGIKKGSTFFHTSFQFLKQSVETQFCIHHLLYFFFSARSEGEAHLPFVVFVDVAEVHDITINEAMLLCCLKDGETKSAGMICEYIGLSNSRVSKVITAVENKGYIRRNINKNDKRQMCFSVFQAAE